MYFDEDFVKSLPDDPYAALKDICDRYLSFSNQIQTNSQEEYDLVVETSAFLSKFSEVAGISIFIVDSIPKNRENIDSAHSRIMDVRADAISWSTRSKLERYENLLATKFGRGFYYEFSEGDLKLIQNLINELRELISTTEELKEDHRHRLIKKLEKVQSELHKRVSNLDRFWGFCLDLSIVIGLMGKNAEPAADLVKKILDIVWPTQTRAYDLPSSLPFKLLGQPENDKSENSKS